MRPSSGAISNLLPFSELFQRGWTTWITGAIEERIIAIAPVVLTDLNMGPVRI